MLAKAMEGSPLQTRHWNRHGGAGLTFTELGLGTAPLANLYRAIPDSQAWAVMEAAWAGGVRHYDTAPLYGLGLAEIRLNPFLRGKPRDSYVLSSKIGRLLAPCPPERRLGIGKWFDVPNRTEVYDYGYDGVMRSLEFSLERLGVDRIDLVYAHDLDVFTHGSAAARDARIAQFLSGGAQALIRLREEGVIAAWGAGVNEWQACQVITERSDPDIFLLAGRFTLLEQEALDSFLPLAVRRGIGVVIGGPYNSGILATGARPGAWYNYDPAPPAILTRVARIEAVCAAHQVPLVQAAFQFPLRHPAVLSVIPGGQAPAEMAGNLAAAAAVIPPDLWAELKAEGLLRADAPV
jgi:D-threo-aldose 1-dehydrogenase